MGKYLKKFENHTEYEGASQNLILPNVSLCAQENEVHYNPLPYQGFCKLTLNDGTVVELEGNGQLVVSMVNPYRETIVSAEIGELCTSIDGGAFNTCSGLTNVTIGNSVTRINIAAFSNCSGLTSVTIGNGVTIINSGAFASCINLSTITSHIMNAPSVQPGTFTNVKNGGTLYVPIDSSGYETWMNDQNLGPYNWTKVEQ